MAHPRCIYIVQHKTGIAHHGVYCREMSRSCRKQKLTDINLVLMALSPVHTSDKVEFNTVDFVESRPFAETGNKSATKSTVADTVDFVASVYGAKATRSTFNKVDRVEFNFVASAYRALHFSSNALHSTAATAALYTRLVMWALCDKSNAAEVHFDSAMTSSHAASWATSVSSKRVIMRLHVGLWCNYRNREPAIHRRAHLPLLLAGNVNMSCAYVGHISWRHWRRK